jgi:hypothetical protein
VTGNAPIDFGRLYDTRIVIDDVEAAKAAYSDLLGVTWGVLGESEMPVWLSPNSTDRSRSSERGPASTSNS